jgi:TonB family protein
MHRKLLAALIVMLAASISLGQQNRAPASSKSSQAQPALSTYYSVGPDVTSPELIPSNPLPVFTGKCKKQDDSVEFVVIVDKTGEPRSILYSRGLVTDSDKLALQIVTADRFMPGTHNGEPTAVVISVTVSLKGCIESTKDESGHKSELFHLRSQPAQELAAIVRPPGEMTPVSSFQPSMNSDGPEFYRVGGSVTAPVPLNSVEAHYTNAARKAKIQGNCWISFIVNANGIPQTPKVIHGLDPGLDQNALDSVSKYRFRPAMKDGHPVPVILTVQVNFKLY